MFYNKRNFCRSMFMLGMIMITVIIWIMVRKFNMYSYMCLDQETPMDSFITYIVKYGAGTGAINQCNMNIQNYVILILCKMTGKVIVGLNLYFIFSFFLIATSMYWCLQRYHVPYAICVFGAVIASLLPFHVDRGEGQIVTSNFAAVPIIVVCFYDFFWISNKNVDKKYVLFFCILPFWDVNLAVMTIIIMAFLCILKHEQAITKKALVYTLPMILIIMFLGGLSQDKLQEGIRGASENGIRLLDFVVPIRGHIIRKLYDFRCEYDVSFIAHGESGLNSLGILLSLVFILSILKLLLDNTCNKIVGWLSWINLAVILTAYNDGICVFFEYIGIHIEFWNRMAVFILVNTIIIMGLFYKEAQERYKHGFQCHIFKGACIVIGVGTLIELVLRH